jgi:biopolymer transport protein ExbD
MKRRFGRKRDEDEVGFQLAPMIDMTFLLLIFFMVTTKITKEQKKMDIRLPLAASARTPEDFAGRDIVNIDDEGRIFTGDNPVTQTELRTYLQKRLAAVPPLIVYVRADSKTDVKIVKEVMRTCASAGAVEVIFGSHRK